MNNWFNFIVISRLGCVNYFIFLEGNEDIILNVRFLRVGSYMKVSEF